MRIPTKKSKREIAKKKMLNVSNCDQYSKVTTSWEKDRTVYSAFMINLKNCKISDIF